MQASHHEHVHPCADAGVKLHTFHSTTSALPSLPWDSLLSLACPNVNHSAALLLLSEPHFTQVCQPFQSMLAFPILVYPLHRQASHCSALMKYCRCEKICTHGSKSVRFARDGP